VTASVAGFAVLDANPLGTPGVGAGELLGARATPVVWSGTLGAGLFEVHLPTWGPEAWAALGRWCDGVRSELDGAGRRVLLRPHARHVLSDVQRCVRFFDERAGQPFGLALEPSALFEPSMLETADDHLTRIFTFLGPRAAVLIRTDAAPGVDAADPMSRPPLGKGVLNAALYSALAADHQPPNTPVIE